MNSNMIQDLQTVNKLSQSQYLKKAFKFLLSLSIFSFLLPHYSWLLFFLHYSTVLHSINKNYMFLVCNIGILVFLSRNSGFVGSTSSLPFKGTTDHILLEDVDEFIDEINRENLQLDHHQDLIQPDQYSEMNYDLEEEELEVLFLITQQGHDEYEQDVDQEDEENGLLSGDELKKKFDDFIKKVKEQIRIEA